MTREELKQLRTPYIMTEGEVESAIEFVRDLLEFYANELHNNEPYATNTINRLESAAYVVGDLIYYVNELEEN